MKISEIAEYLETKDIDWIQRCLNDGLLQSTKRKDVEVFKVRYDRRKILIMKLKELLKSGKCD